MGVSASALDEEGLIALKFIAQVASLLGIRTANEEDLLLRWTDLVVQDFESTEQNVWGISCHHDAGNHLDQKIASHQSVVLF